MMFVILSYNKDSNMGAGRTGQGGALAPPWNFKIIIIIVYKCNMYYL